MKSNKEILYEELLRRFEEVARACGGWQTEIGILLDGKLWALAATLTQNEVEIR